MVKTIFLAKNVFFFHLKHFFMKKKYFLDKLLLKYLLLFANIHFGKKLIKKLVMLCKV